ncbi:hypothetical protein DAPPUDRAFT_96671 [Daphnia pulex]|uniref:Uncharacterized protein n=1 Tax=Daphnia pulex TaxID=6669 RepID=E9FYJ8_DAPPU|nr:hypothetical protein DAPPUDRAFT_96671 [Daphnia pulex]|eukprot:EFX87540.1 hypothetical protein DAPPUDRAFT_96671 [Daphnia pulex]
MTFHSQHVVDPVRRLAKYTCVLQDYEKVYIFISVMLLVNVTCCSLCWSKIFLHQVYLYIAAMFLSKEYVAAYAGKRYSCIKLNRTRRSQKSCHIPMLLSNYQWPSKPTEEKKDLSQVYLTNWVFSLSADPLSSTVAQQVLKRLESLADNMNGYLSRVPSPQCRS